ncbi:MAG: DUF5684 domain-containing protein [Bacteroidetes bacterium]|jgi:hypothetical protein|nr:DUF5684 domain-containing protein [Bacteroidota bacterium]
MDFIYATLGYLQSTFGEGLWVIVPFFAFIGIVAQMRLYAKAEQSAVSAIVPIWNVVTFMKVIGRPAWHAAYIILPTTAMLICLMVDYQNLIAYSQGTLAFSAVAISLPIFSLSAIVFTVFMIWAHIDLCNSFGRRTVFDYVLVVLLNVLYVLNLSLSYEINYEGPAYGTAKLDATGAFAS